MSEIILASASPRRRELMANMGLDFRVVVSEADEESVDSSVPPGIYVQELALLKAAAVAKTVIDNKDAVIISADTIVVKDGKILGKPQDKEDAKRMLRLLSGSSHNVYTGFCVMRLSDAFTVCKDVSTEVVFRELDDEKIDRYIRTDECMDKTGSHIRYTDEPRYYWEDKAGAYGIQDPFGMKYIKRINGDYYNVVGLPVSALWSVLQNEFDFE